MFWDLPGASNAGLSYSAVTSLYICQVRPAFVCSQSEGAVKVLDLSACSCQPAHQGVMECILLEVKKILI